MAIYRYDTLVPNLHPETFVAEQATVIGDVTLAQGVSVWPQAVLRGDNEPIHIGQHSNVQEGAVLHADPGFNLTVGSGVTIGHQAMLHGCTIGDGALIGIQAVVLNGAVIGRNCLVGAGAIVTEGKVFPDNSLILGAPAKVVRELSPEAIAHMHANAADYVRKGQACKEKLVRIG
ncbi:MULTISPECIES: gamma carbonic anhydrase family protein [Pseudomonas]|jgi:carbonic anhydrase/acetyltransferase-like protein (isoleucine patch superfamily)|uniref:Gamma carbonic anhydrase family protein n=2 Tax=Pseudomonas putida TaxID=303 RepID=A0A7Y7ZCC3_PSEPU|nr:MULTISPECIES: gamma carbonic anhydrase family protein [Pseudomonas]KAF1311416.1 gamma carbonic anhydrase family protein [Pseudomonas sp. SG-MS2]MDH1574198.1 gamma carbonic anhydrase family protein [Pseudomonas sp. GD03746]NWC81793.1 gamma carbonic anhydrase family protein [Pseudomonas putida]QQE86529.1 gamma carbonic anhydrase family protein [Pseudomonas putida]UTL83543.1 gamma carbonic anhydrase family protein [Pseudomonas putida]